MENEVFERIKNKILKYIASSNKTIAQITRKLNEYGCSESLSQKILEFLINYHYVDDESYTENFVHDSLNLKHHGKIKIKYELEQKKILPSIIYSALEKINDDDEIETAVDFVQKRFSYKMSDKKNCDKLKNMLYRRGFSFNIINSVMKKINDT